jgi:DNA-directed RNA polymerase specialized sigma subunit
MPTDMLEDDYRQPFMDWKADPSPTNTGRLLKAVQPVLRTAVRSYAGPSARSANIKSRAKTLAVEAFSSYDPARGALKGHLMSRLQRLRRDASRQRQIIRMPEQAALNQMQAAAASKELEEQLGRPPSDQELADFTGLSTKRLQYIRSGVRPVATSTITRRGEEGMGGFDPRVRDLQENHDAWLQFVYDDLDPTNQFIMERVLGMNGHPTTPPTRVAQQLRVSPAAVSHRMAHIQKKLDKRDELEML